MPFLGICGIHVAAPLLLELECSLCPECGVSGAVRTDHVRQEKNIWAPASRPVIRSRSNLLLVRKLCINDARILADFTKIFYSRMPLAGNISLVICRGGGGTRTKTAGGFISGKS